MYNTLNNPSAHPSYSHYYLLSPSTLFFLHILLFFAHLIVLHFLFHCTFYSYFSFFTIYMLLCCVTLYNFYFYYVALSTERTWFDYISLLIIPCIIYYVTNKETLNLEPWRSISVLHPWCWNMWRVSSEAKETWRETVEYNPLEYDRHCCSMQLLRQSLKLKS